MGSYLTENTLRLRHKHQPIIADRKITVFLFFVFRKCTVTREWRIFSLHGILPHRKYIKSTSQTPTGYSWEEKSSFSFFV